MTKGRRRTAAAIAGIALGGTAVAIAAAPGPNQEEVSAQLYFTHASGHEKTCPGPNGTTFLEQRVVAQGVSTGDPRLSGDVEVHVRLWTTFENSPGVQYGTIRIR